jgi:hypothetical protein
MGAERVQAFLRRRLLEPHTGGDGNLHQARAIVGGDRLAQRVGELVATDTSPTTACSCKPSRYVKSAGRSRNMGNSVEPGLAKMVVIPCARNGSRVASRTVAMAAGPYSAQSTSCAARSPDRTAPSM